MDIQKTIQEFRKFSREEKKTLCLEVLSDSKPRGGIFVQLWNLIQTDGIADEDLDNIYESAMVVLSSTENTKINESLGKLTEARDKLALLKEQEEEERRDELTIAETTLLNYPYS